MSLTPKLIPSRGGGREAFRPGLVDRDAGGLHPLPPARRPGVGPAPPRAGELVKALAMNRDVGQWQLQLTPQEIRVTDATSKQTLVFGRRRAAARRGSQARQGRGPRTSAACVLYP